ncbi:hypothetical protein MGG_15650 [Pyricularia oryzae 70-15]|uniref:Uncharacterized protein n=3 Tax=Pyricularia oryzae TaxID=318829 RepID=G4MXJ7_PYRO7|nr:uncharacterized protein MGG_15650 [Pyricularia oryzae 70-15]EHA54328.1 hypothetical protein MGG_15650 [Pyricularia oryzae 70-15]ELQ37439.1 hypothetical protein OOU_Y34scaffold00594g23 [Pyricularia oryzae Y34]
MYMHGVFVHASAELHVTVIHRCLCGRYFQPTLNLLLCPGKRGAVKPSVLIELS